ncbi:MAG: hypothetical protein MMC33_003153 [Icmadophila ericetorum]|nr:hypothetical protein [Icmadophila ericetorum]
MPPSPPPSAPATLAKSISPPSINAKPFSTQLHSSTKTKRPPLTHFLCIPLKFKEDLAAWKGPQGPRDPSSRVIAEANTFSEKGDESAKKNEEDDAGSPDEGSSTTTTNLGQSLLPAIRPLGTLHLTLGVMSLPTPARIQEAISHLQNNIDVQSHLRRALKISGPPVAAGPSDPETGEVTHLPRQEGGQLKVSIKGLHTMGSARQTSVLYAEPHPETLANTSTLMTFATFIRNEMLSAGFLLPENHRGSTSSEDDGLLLHMTLLNTIYIKGARQAGKGGSKNGKARRKGGVLKFDARELSERYRETVWAEGVVVGRVAVCEMGAKEGVSEWGGKDRGKGVAYRDLGGLDL